jgi:hypothetical protein
MPGDDDIKRARMLCRDMNRKNNFTEFPERVPAGTKRPGTYYARMTDRYAVHYGQPTDDIAGAQMIFKQEGIAMFEGEPDAPPARSGIVTPVYQLHPDGAPAVPTGKVFLRFNESVDAATRRAEIEQAGYEVIQTSPYTPHNVWVQSLAGDVAQSLSKLANLEGLKDVENVEPQMIVGRSLREN